ncbi:MAG: isoleucine--tRNA ligase [Pseudomonadota bacterium]
MCAKKTDAAKSAPAAAGADVDYKSTIFLPQTDFPMRAGLPKREPDWLARWEKMGLYDRQREASNGRERYELHDGPPYANGHLHIGHALNKILKDIVVRSHQGLGYDSRYVPGWDCHGLPIEWKIEEKYRAKGKNKDEVPVNDFRAECRKFAEGWIDVQRAEFKRLGITGEWDAPYTTMAYKAEATIAREFMKFVMNGTLYRGSKPVMWSPIEQTALAEAEVEYHDHESHTIWVKFPLVKAPKKLKDARIVIWTTTPWTIPSNRGIAFGEGIKYGLYKVTEAPADNWAVPGDLVIMADALAEEALKKGRVETFERVANVTPKELEKCVAKHPLAAADPFWDYDVPLLAGDFVTDDAGTGFVHCAPSHGLDDFELFVSSGLADRMTFNVTEEGAFASHVPGGLAGRRILKPNGKEGDANKAVIELLMEAGGLLARGKLKHSYPHSWRSKAPLIYRNTPQWFIAIDKPLRDTTPYSGKSIRQRALESIDRDVRWVPKTGRNRLYSMIETRPDWVVSRQRAWGVPLCCFMRRQVVNGVEEVEILRDEMINERIARAFEEDGADAWFAEDAKSRFLGNEYDHEEWEIVTDILDVWFDSGSTHSFVMEGRQRNGKADGMWPASIYLEGTDQHRGWFHSSLLEACGTRGRAPYDCVLTHGFTLDEKGQKMSKSLGNIIAPEKVVKEYGADVLRLWVVQTDFTEDQRIGPEILKGVADSYRRLRNTMRFMLGALSGFDESERVAPEEMPELERWVLHRLTELDQVVRQGYRDFEYSKLFAEIFAFCTVDLSSFYFDIRKDSLYCDGVDSLQRRACRTVMDILFHRLTAWLSPMLVFTMEDVWLSRFPEDEGSVHLQTIPETPAAWSDPALAEKWEQVRRIRRVVTGALEVERREKRIGASLEAAPVVHISNKALNEVAHSVDLCSVCITSGIEVKKSKGPADAFSLPEIEGVSVVVKPAKGTKCQRCWQVLPEVGTLAAPGICARCESVVSSLPSGAPVALPQHNRH